jgi:hypothetical protein
MGEPRYKAKIASSIRDLVDCEENVPDTWQTSIYPREVKNRVLNGRRVHHPSHTKEQASGRQLTAKLGLMKAVIMRSRI